MWSLHLSVRLLGINIRKMREVTQKQGATAEVKADSLVYQSSFPFQFELEKFLNSIHSNTSSQWVDRAKKSIMVVYFRV